MKNATSITTTSITTSTAKKSSYNAKTKIVAMVLSIITAFSVLTVSIGSVSAAENNSASASNSVDVGGLISGVTTSVVAKAIDLGTKSNPVTAILGAGVSSVFGTVFGSIFSHKDKTQAQILSEVKGISEEIKSNHAEEMAELNNIEQMIQAYQQEIKQTAEAYGETIIDEVQMQSFNTSCGHTADLYNSIFDQIYYSCKDLPYTDEEVQLIDEATYTAYSKVLTKTGFCASTDIEVQFNAIYRYLSASQENYYNLLIDKYKKSIERKGPQSFESMSDFHTIQSNIDQIESDAVMYYIAYTTLLQMDYQCDNYRYNLNKSAYDELSMSSAIAEINDAADKMSKINDAYTSACSLIDSLTTASVTKGSTTKYFVSTPVAWAVTASELNTGASITFTLLQDWNVSLDDTLKDISQDKLEQYGFNPDTGNPEIYLSTNLTINIPSALIQVDQMVFNFRDGADVTFLISSDCPYYAGYMPFITVYKATSSASTIDGYNYVESSTGLRRIEYYIHHAGHGLI